MTTNLLSVFNVKFVLVGDVTLLVITLPALMLPPSVIVATVVPFALNLRSSLCSSNVISQRLSVIPAVASENSNVPGPAFMLLTDKLTGVVKPLSLYSL